MALVIDEEVYLEHFGVRGMRWGVRRENDNTGRDSSPSEKKMSRNKKVAIATGVGIAVGGALYLASRNTKVRAMSKKIMKSGQRMAAKQLQSQSKKRLAEIRSGKAAAAAAQQARMKENQKLRDSIMANHNVSKNDFDKWLTKKENEQGYRYQGPR